MEGPQQAQAAAGHVIGEPTAAAAGGGTGREWVCNPQAATALADGGSRSPSPADEDPDGAHATGGGSAADVVEPPPALEPTHRGRASRTTGRGGVVGDVGRKAEPDEGHVMPQPALGEPTGAQPAATPTRVAVQPPPRRGAALASLTVASPGGMGRKRARPPASIDPPDVFPGPPDFRLSFDPYTVSEPRSRATVSSGTGTSALRVSSHAVAAKAGADPADAVKGGSKYTVFAERTAAASARKMSLSATRRELGADGSLAPARRRASSTHVAPYLRKPVKAGWLYKRGKLLKGWKRRWFELDGEQLAYYKGPKSKQPQSTILGANVVSVEFYDSIKHGRVSSWPTPHRFVIIVRQRGQKPRRYYICAEEKMGLDDWGAALQFYLKLLRTAPDWNGHFQTLRTEFRQIVSAPAALRHVATMHKVVHRFERLATTAVTAVVHEIALPRYQQSIPVFNNGRVRGLYEAAGMHIKIAVDSSGLFGSDSRAMKAAGHELRGMQAYLDVPNMGKVCFPLMLQIDYCGYRVTAYAAVPVTPDTIVYGSNDGGRTVHANEPGKQGVNGIMRHAAAVLRLRAHRVGTGTRDQELHAAGDVEVHVGEDSRTYLLNTARAMPPALSSYHKRHRGDVWVRQLRPELLAQHHTPLCPDAGTTWSRADAAAEVRRVRHATRALEQCVVPRLASSLIQEYVDRFHTPGRRHDDDPAGPPTRPRTPGPETEQPASSPTASTVPVRRDAPSHLSSLVILAHRAGVNLRYLGLLRRHVWKLKLDIERQLHEQQPAPDGSSGSGGVDAPESKGQELSGSSDEDDTDATVQPQSHRGVVDGAPESMGANAGAGAGAHTLDGGVSARAASGARSESGTSTLSASLESDSSGETQCGPSPHRTPHGVFSRGDVGVRVVQGELPSLDVQLASARRLLRHLLTEMVARIVKGTLRARMRTVVRAPVSAGTSGSTQGAGGRYTSTHGPLEDVVVAVVQVINDVFEIPRCTPFWQRLPGAIANKYVDGLHPSECSAQMMMNAVDKTLLFARIQELCGVRFVSAAVDVVQQGVALTPAYVRIEGILPQLRRLNYFCFEEGYALLEAVLMHESSDPGAAILRAQSRFQQAVCASPCDHNTLNMWGLSYRLLADHVDSQAAEHARARAVQLYTAAVCLEPEFPEALTNLGNVLCDQQHVAAGCACFMTALLVAPQYANALNALAFQVSSDESAASGVPQMKRLLMEVAGRTAVLKDELYYSVSLLRDLCPEHLESLQEARLQCLRLATAAERAHAVCSSGLVASAFRIVVELPPDAPALAIALCFLERVYKLYDVVWPAHQFRVASAAARAMCDDAKATNVIPKMLDMLRRAHPSTATAGTWRLPAVYTVMPMLPVLTTMCGDVELRRQALEGGLVDALVPWFASPSTAVRTSALCLLTKFADTAAGLEAFKRVPQNAGAGAGLFTGRDAAWISLWVELSRHPHSELRRVASESLRSFFNFSDGTRLLVRHKYLHQLVDILHRQLVAASASPSSPVGVAPSRAGTVPDPALVVETLETLTWATHSDAGGAGVAAVAALGVSRVLVPFMAPWYPAQTRFLAASVLLHMSEHEVGRAAALRQPDVMTACKDIITGVPPVRHGHSRSRQGSFGAASQAPHTPLPAPPQGDLSQVVLQAVKLYLNLTAAPRLVARLELPPSYSLARLVLAAVPARRHLLYQILASIASEPNAAATLAAAGAPHQLMCMLNATMGVDGGAGSHAASGGTRGAVGGRSGERRHSGGVGSGRSLGAGPVPGDGRRGSGGPSSSRRGSASAPAGMRARRSIRNVSERQMANDVVVLLVVISASDTAVAAVASHEPLIRRVVDLLTADPMDSHVLQICANVAQVHAGRSLLLGMGSRFTRLLLPALAALSARIVKRMTRGNARRDSDTSSVSGWSDFSSSAGGSWGGVLAPLAHSNTSQAAATCVDCLTNLCFSPQGIRVCRSLRNLSLGAEPEYSMHMAAGLGGDGGGGGSGLDGLDVLDAAPSPAPRLLSDLFELLVELVRGQAGSGVQLYAYELCTRLSVDDAALETLVEKGLVPVLADAVVSGAGEGASARQTPLCARALRLLEVCCRAPSAREVVREYMRLSSLKAAASFGGRRSSTGSVPPAAAAASAHGTPRFVTAWPDPGSPRSLSPRSLTALSGDADSSPGGAGSVSGRGAAVANKSLLETLHQLLLCFDVACQADAASVLEALVEDALHRGGGTGECKSVGEQPVGQQPQAQAQAQPVTRRLSGGDDGSLGLGSLAQPGDAIACTGRSVDEWAALVTDNARGEQEPEADGDTSALPEESDDSAHTIRVVAGCRALHWVAMLQVQRPGGPAALTHDVLRAVANALSAGVAHANWYARLAALRAAREWCRLPDALRVFGECAKLCETVGVAATSAAPEAPDGGAVAADSAGRGDGGGAGAGGGVELQASSGVPARSDGDVRRASSASERGREGERDQGGSRAPQAVGVSREEHAAVAAAAADLVVRLRGVA